MVLTLGTRLGPYEILSALGAGGMGEVYRARDTTLNRDIAIKILPESLANDPDRLARFQREAQVLASLNHPNIAHIHGLEQSGGVRALVMELVEGEDLAQRIAHGAVPLDEALPIAKQIAEALEAAHDRGIVHRDLKPANIKITPAGVVKVLDFGLAKAIEGAGETGRAGPAGRENLTQSPTITSPVMMTGVGTILGTASYMSPEQARGKTVDKRADIWAFGCVLFEMLTGRRAFEGDTISDVLAKVIERDPNWTALPSATPTRLRELLRRSLNKDPNARLRDIGDARIEIEEAIAKPAGGLSGISPSPNRRSIAQLIPWGAAALVAVAWLLTFVIHRTVPPPSLPVTRLELNLPNGVELAGNSVPSISIAPDGTRVAFIGSFAGLKHIYVRRLDDFESTAIRGTETASTCFFAPSGRALAFYTSTGTLKTVSLADGLVTTIALDGAFSNSGSWGPDDRITFGKGGAFWQVPSVGGQAQPLTELDTKQQERLHTQPNPVAGSNAILFTSVLNGDRTVTNIDAFSLATRERHRVMESASNPMYVSSGHLLFFRNGTLLAAPFDASKIAITGSAVALLDNISVDQLGNPLFAVSNSGHMAFVPSSNATKRLVWVSRQGVEQSISDTSRPYQNPRLSPDGQRIVVEVNGGDLWIQDVTRATFTRLTSGETLGNTFAVWTPDSQRVVFRTLTGLRVIEAGGGGSSVPIADTSVADIPTSISPDGETLAFVRQLANASGGIFTLSLKGNPRPRVLLKAVGYNGAAQLSPDGRWMAYVSNESGEFEVYVRPYPGPDRKVPVSAQGGTHPKWSRNGKELFFRRGNKMMVVDVQTKPDISLSQPRMLFEQRYAFGAAQTIANYDVSSDGQRFLMVKDESSSDRLNVVLNWFEELKARVPTR